MCWQFNLLVQNQSYKVICLDALTVLSRPVPSWAVLNIATGSVLTLVRATLI